MSKGSSPRPLSVPQETFAERWERTFGAGGARWKPYRLPSRSEASDDFCRAVGLDPESLPIGLYGRILPEPS